MKNEVVEDSLSMIAAGVAFYAFLAIFPALAALVSIYGLVIDPADLQKNLGSLESVMPSGAAQVVNQELARIVTAQHSRLGWSLAVSLLVALWSASKGMKAMFQSMNIAYDEKERRGFVKLNSMAIMVTLAAILFGLIFLGLIVAGRALLETFGLGAAVAVLVAYARWPVLALGGIFALTVLYRYGPSREKPQWKWVSWGAVIATVIWLIGSVLFSFYVSHFGSYNKTYGSLAVIIVLMTWLLLSVYSILLGAEVNAVMEHQTAMDTTTGEPRPMGRRGAHVADTVGR